jgi:hypothetical protein
MATRNHQGRLIKKSNKNPTSGNAVDTDFPGNFLQRVRHLLLLGSTLPAVVIGLDVSSHFAAFFPTFLFRVAAKLSASQNVPSTQSHTVFASHRKNVTLESTVHDVPAALVHCKWGLAMVNGVLVAL